MKRNENDFQGLNIAPPDEEEESEPLDMSWPDTWSKRLSYVLVLPLILPMWVTLPDTRKPAFRNFYPITFVGSILWIAVFSYLMVWWSTITGEAFSIPPEVIAPWKVLKVLKYKLQTVIWSLYCCCIPAVSKDLDTFIWLV